MIAKNIRDAILVAFIIMSVPVAMLAEGSGGAECSAESKTGGGTVSNDCKVCVTTVTGEKKWVGASCTVTGGGDKTSANCAANHGVAPGTCDTKYCVGSKCFNADVGKKPQLEDALGIKNEDGLNNLHDLLNNPKSGATDVTPVKDDPTAGQIDQAFQQSPSLEKTADAASSLSPEQIDAELNKLGMGLDPEAKAAELQAAEEKAAQLRAEGKDASVQVESTLSHEQRAQLLAEHGIDPSKLDPQDPLRQYLEKGVADTFGKSSELSGSGSCSGFFSCAVKTAQEGFQDLFFGDKTNAKLLGFRDATIYCPGGCPGSPIYAKGKEGPRVGSSDNYIDSDMDVVAAGGKDLKFGDVVKVTNPETGLSEYAVVGDTLGCYPNCSGRIDLTEGLANKLGFYDGHQSMKVEVVSRGSSWSEGLAEVQSLNSGQNVAWGGGIGQTTTNVAISDADWGRVVTVPSSSQIASSPPTAPSSPSSRDVTLNTTGNTVYDTSFRPVQTPPVLTGGSGVRSGAILPIGGSPVNTIADPSLGRGSGAITQVSQRAPETRVQGGGSSANTSPPSGGAITQVSQHAPSKISGSPNVSTYVQSDPATVPSVLRSGAGRQSGLTLTTDANTAAPQGGGISQAANEAQQPSLVQRATDAVSNAASNAWSRLFGTSPEGSPELASSGRETTGQSAAQSTGGKTDNYGAPKGGGITQLQQDVTRPVAPILQSETGRLSESTGRDAGGDMPPAQSVAGRIAQGVKQTWEDVWGTPTKEVSPIAPTGGGLTKEAARGTSPASSASVAKSMTVPPELERNYLELGDKNPAVTELQRFLNEHGYPLAKEGYGSPGNETDEFGPRTLAAVKEWQDSHGLTADGLVGPETLARMNEISAKSAAQSSAGVAPTAVEKIGAIAAASPAETTAGDSSGHPQVNAIPGGGSKQNTIYDPDLTQRNQVPGGGSSKNILDTAFRNPAEQQTGILAGKAPSPSESSAAPSGQQSVTRGLSPSGTGQAEGTALPSAPAPSTPAETAAPPSQLSPAESSFRSSVVSLRNSMQRFVKDPTEQNRSTMVSRARTAITRAGAVPGGDRYVPGLEKVLVAEQYSASTIQMFGMGRVKAGIARINALLASGSK